MIAMLDGPRLGPAEGTPVTALVILLHGYGSNGDDLIPLAIDWRGALPGAAFVAPMRPSPARVRRTAISGGASPVSTAPPGPPASPAPHRR